MVEMNYYILQNITYISITSSQVDCVVWILLQVQILCAQVPASAKGKKMWSAGLSSLSLIIWKRTDQSFIMGMM